MSDSNVAQTGHPRGLVHAVFLRNVGALLLLWHAHIAHVVFGEVPDERGL